MRDLLKTRSCLPAGKFGENFLLLRDRRRGRDVPELRSWRGSTLNEVFESLGDVVPWGGDDG